MSGSYRQPPEKAAVLGAGGEEEPMLTVEPPTAQRGAIRVGRSAVGATAARTMSNYQEAVSR